MFKLSVLTSLLCICSFSYADLSYLDSSNADSSEQQQIVELEQQVSTLKDTIDQLMDTQKKLANTQILKNKPEITVEPPIQASTRPGWMMNPATQTQIKFYGSFRVHSTYDFAGSTERTTDIFNPTNRVPLNSENATKGSLNVSAATTVLGVEFIQPTKYGDVLANIEGDFMSNNTLRVNGSGGFRLRHAYLEWGNWLVGQTNSPFESNETSPATVDVLGPMGSSGNRVVQARYTKAVSENQNLAVALEGGDVDLFAGTQQTTGGGRLPSVAAKYDYAFPNQKGRLQLYGLVHENRVSTNNDNDTEKWGWGLGVGTRINLTAKDTVFMQHYHLKGDNRYTLYAGPNPAYVVTVDADGKYIINRSEYSTFLLGYVHLWTPKWRSSLIGGTVWYRDTTPYAKALAGNPLNNKRVYNIIGNSFYTPVRNFDLGMEYTYGQRETFTGEKGDYSRINLLMRYNF